MSEEAKFNRLFLGDDQTIEVDGFDVSARIEYDDSMGRPWEEHDGHGPVSEWTRRAKRPGERVLHDDRGSYLYYDWQEAIQIAKRDGWDAEPYGTGTPGQRAERAVAADFKRLRDWCRNEWCWVGVVLSVSKNGVTLDEHAASLWGIESDCGDYLVEVANDMIPEAVEAGRRVLESLGVRA